MAEPSEHMSDGDQHRSLRQQPPGRPAEGPASILRRTQPWARLLAIFGFVASGVIVVGGGWLAVGWGRTEALTREDLPTLVLPLAYAAWLAFLYLLPSLYLLRYAKRIREFITQGQAGQLDAALEAQRRVWKCLGILTLVGLVVTPLIIALGVLAPLLAPPTLPTPTMSSLAPIPPPPPPPPPLPPGVVAEVLSGIAGPAPAPAPPTERKALRVGGNIPAPKKIRDVPPVYPAAARAAGVGGVVILEITISPEGKVIQALILRSIPLLDESAVDAVKQWEYQPTRLNGKPVSVVMTATVFFQP